MSDVIIPPCIQLGGQKYELTACTSLNDLYEYVEICKCLGLLKFAEGIVC